MELKVSVPDVVVERARARGIRPEVYVEQIVADHVNGSEAAGKLRTAAQIRAWLDSMAQFSERVPPLPDRISREWIYQDHD